MDTRPLTQQEKDAYAKRQVQLAERELEIRTHLKEYSKPIKDEIKDIKAERDNIAQITSLGVTMDDEVQNPFAELRENYDISKEGETIVFRGKV